ncbi:MAG TPA: hypothetical protein PLG90_10005 [Ignavibacteria bacterium]|nr:hypothetical protein [Ignavibacteria bacterium]
MADFISKILFYFLCFSAKIIPISLIRKIAEFIGIIVYYLIPIRKNIAYENIKKCFPKKDENWKKLILKKAYINLFINLFEFFYFNKINSDNVLKYFSVENPEVMENAINSGRTILLTSGHFSNWELSAYAFPLIFKKPLDIIAKQQSNDELNILINKTRSISGNKIIQTGFSLRALYKLISGNNIIAFLIDQSAHSNSADYVDFFGMNVASFNGVSKLSLKYHTELLFAHAIRNDDYTYSLYMQRINYENLTQVEITQKLQSILQKVIEDNPSQWVWFHRRFKHLKK